MKIRFLFLTILLSCSVIAQETPAPGEAETEAEAADQPREDRADNESEKQGEESGDAGSSPGDFRPSQEISEDFPVPLPADI